MDLNDLKIDPEFEEKIPPLTEDEFSLKNSPNMVESISYSALKKDSFSCFRKRSAIGVKV